MSRVNWWWFGTWNMCYFNIFLEMIQFFTTFYRLFQPFFKNTRVNWSTESTGPIISQLETWMFLFLLRQAISAGSYRSSQLVGDSRKTYCI